MTELTFYFLQIKHQYDARTRRSMYQFLRRFIKPVGTKTIKVSGGNAYSNDLEAIITVELYSIEETLAFYKERLHHNKYQNYKRLFPHWEAQLNIIQGFKMNELKARIPTLNELELQQLRSNIEVSSDTTANKAIIINLINARLNPTAETTSVVHSEVLPGDFD